MKTKNNITTFDEILDKKYGKRGNAEREKWEQEQEELAIKCGTNKSYISRIENNASDIRLSTIMKIIQTGLGGHLKLTLQL